MPLYDLLRWKRASKPMFATPLIFPEGIYGYEHLREFVWEGKRGWSPYSALRSLEEDAVAFLVADPFQIDHAYLPDLCAQDFAHDGDYLLLVIVMENHELNLNAPLLIDWEKREGRQVLLSVLS